MPRTEVLLRLAEVVAGLKRPHPARVAIDGVDAAGKTTLADELAETIAGRRPVLRASIDGFHRPREERYRRGLCSPEGYYLDSFDYGALRRFLLEPLGPGGDRRFRRAVFDFSTDTHEEHQPEVAEPDAVLLFDGIFLLRPELSGSWDLAVFVDVDADEALRRALARDEALFGSREAARERYERRYVPGQRLYFEEARPRERADVVIENTDPERPRLVRVRVAP